MITEYLDLGAVSNRYNQVTVLDGAQLVVGEGSHFEVEADVRMEGNSGFSIGGGSTVAIHGDLHVLDNSVLSAGTLNRSSQIDGEWRGSGVTLTAWQINVDSNAVITADGVGYSGGSSGPGFGPGAGNATSDYAAGGGHGGIGGAGRNGSPAGGAIYGSTRRPTEPGSGGGSAGGSGTGGAGGGALRIIAWEQLQLDGGLQADGGNATAGSDSGGGAGGSIWVDAAMLSGSGWMSATGGNGRYDGGGGGGGCIAAYYWDASTWNPDVSMSGGSDYRDGASGTFVTGKKSAYWWLGSEAAVKAISDTGINMDIGFLISGTTNVIEQRRSLTSGDWEPVHTFVAQGSQTNLSLLSDESWQEVFYRIQTQIEVPELDQ